MSIYAPKDSPYKKLTWIPTGYSSLDRILGGGVATRKITEFSGNYSVGKSSLALSVVAQAQALKMKVLWADSEFSFDEKYAEALGVDGRIELLTDRYAEVILDEIEKWADEHKNALIVLDSVGQLLPREQAEKRAEGKTIGGQAKLIAVFCRKMLPILAINNIALLVLNHNLIDIMSGKIKTSGGSKLEYAKSCWLMLRKANKRVMNGENEIGAVIEAQIRKNKLAPTMSQSVELTMLYGQGFHKQADLIQDALDSGKIEKRGQSYFIGDEKLARGLAGLREWASANTERLQELIKGI